VFIVISVYFVIHSVQKLLDTPSYCIRKILMITIQNYKMLKQDTKAYLIYTVFQESGLWVTVVLLTVFLFLFPFFIPSSIYKG